MFINIFLIILGILFFTIILWIAIVKFVTKENFGCTHLNRELIIMPASRVDTNTTGFYYQLILLMKAMRLILTEFGVFVRKHSLIVFAKI